MFVALSMSLEPLLVCFRSSLTVCLVGQILGGVENIWGKMGWKSEFSTVWYRVENARDGKPGRKISLPGPPIFSSQIGRKIKGRKVGWTWTYWNALHWPISFKTFTYPSETFVQITYHIFSSSSFYLPSTPSCSRFSPLLFFFFFFSFYVHEPLKQCLCNL